MNNYMLTFIIAMKYYRGYESYLQYYIDNIKKFYPNSLVIVVDNNSTHKDDIFDKLKHYGDVVLLENNIECKFELGAYQVGIKYLLDNDLLGSTYCVFTQDNFILKNKYDFNILLKNNVKACTINSFRYDYHMNHITERVLGNLNLLDNLDKVTFCWGNSFIVGGNKVLDLYEYLKTIIITIRAESEASERYMARILWELNDHNNFDIDGIIQQKLYEHASPAKYDCGNVDPYAEISDIFFLKKVQQKNERTLDHE
jgi:hypothetical protein